MEKVQYSSEKSYRWNPEDQMTITGMELNIIQNALSTLFNSNMPDPQKHVLLHEAFRASTEVIKRSVEGGIIKEVPNEPQAEMQSN